MVDLQAIQHKSNIKMDNYVEGGAAHLNIYSLRFEKLKGGAAQRNISCVSVRCTLYLNQYHCFYKYYRDAVANYK